MNTFEQEPTKIETAAKIELTSDSLDSLDTIWRWASFFSIMGFIFVAFMIVLGLAMGFLLSTLDSTTGGPALKYLIMGLYIVLGGVYFYPILLLFRFANWTKKTLRNRNSLDFSIALKNLKGHFQYVGIMTIILFAVYFIAIIGFIAFKAISQVY
jgi:hypothetical protein